MPATAPRRVIAKAGQLPGKPNPRFAVTSQVRSLARLIGRHGKTDAVDVRMPGVMARRRPENWVRRR